MALNLQTSPYYDDFDIEKNFHRVLFKPGYAVQARELTQLQTILQNQIKRFGDFVFKDGSVVVGCAETFQFAVPYVKLQDVDGNDQAITDTVFQKYMADGNLSLIGKNISNNIGVTAQIISVDIGPSGQRVLFVKYLQASTDGNNVVEFSAEDILTISSPVATFKVEVSSKTPIGVGSLFTIGDGLVYAQGNFVRHVEQTQVLEYFSSTPTKNVGFRVIEEAITTDSDVSLLDPAAGSYNYTAPGADRYKLTTKLYSYETNVVPAPGFYLLFNVESGKVKRAFNKPQLSELQKTLAERTYDESGNYSVNGLNVNIREHLKTATNNGLYTGGTVSELVYGVEPGKAYVEGYETELKATEYLTVSKATDEGSHEEKLISTSFGNYVYVKSVQGDWSITTNNLSVSLKNGGTTYATAKVRFIHHYLGTPGNYTTTFYKLYLHSIVFAGSYTAADLINVTTITDDSGNNTCTVAQTPGDNLGGVVQTSFKLHESSRNTLLFPTTERAVVKFDDNTTDYYYWKKFPTVANINPTATISIDSNEQWLQTGVLSSDDINKYFFVVRDSDHVIIDFTAPLCSINVNSPNSAVLTLSSGNANNHSVYALVKISNVNPIDVTLERNWLKVKGDTWFTGNSKTLFEAGQIYLGASNVYDIEAIYEKVIDSSPSGEDNADIVFPTTEAGLSTWTNVTDKFTFVRNDNDNFLDTSYITGYSGTGITTKKFLIKYRYFRRSTTKGYVNKNSYAQCLLDADPKNPITAPGGSEFKWIYTYQLPVYKSAATGLSYDLRDVIDFRPTKINLTGLSDQINTGKILDKTENSVTGFQTDIIVPDPQSQLTATFSYNLPRIDKVILTRDGEFKVLPGISSLVPQAPNDENHAMTLAQVNLAPYPSLSTYVAKQVGREDYASYVRLVDNRRYTMRDIGSLESRINRLEYYAALNAAENEIANRAILDGSGNVMAKKGILVDNFDGDSVANIFDTSYNAAIDAKKKQLRPGFTLENIEFEVSGSANQKGQAILTGSSYGHEVFISNPMASKARTCGSVLLGNFKNGTLLLDPPQDMWVDVNVRPDVQVNYQGNNDGWEYDNAPFTIHWNNWQTNWQGVVLPSVDPVQVTVVNGVTGSLNYNQSAQLVSDITRSMIAANATPESNLRSIGVRVLDVSIVPFIRSQTVTFIASGLLPYSVVTAKFDGEDVSTYCRSFSGVTAATVKAYKNPALIAANGTPSNYGDKLVVGSDGTLIGQFQIPANTFRTGSRIFSLENSSTSAAAEFFASGVANINDGSINSTRFPQVRQDSLTQTQNSVIQRLISTNPGTFNPSSYGDPMAQTFVIEGESDGTMVTKVDLYFKAKSDTQGVTVEIREVVNGFPGNKIVPFSSSYLSSVNISSDATVATTFEFESPVYLKNNVEYALVILPENNNTDYEIWVSELGENVIGTTERITQQPYVGVLYIPNNTTAWTALEAEDLKFNIYKGVFSGNTTTVTMQSAPVDYITFSQVGSHDLVTGDKVVSGSYTGVVLDVVGKTAKIYVKTGTLAVANTFTVNSTTYTVVSIDDKNITALAPNFGTLTVAPTSSIQFSYKLRDALKVQQTTATPFVNNETLELSNPYKLFSYSHQANSVVVNASLSTNNVGISPILDARKLSMLTVANLSSSTYLTRTVTLDGTADDLRVFLDILMPEGCDVVVKAKMLRAGSDASFDSVSWITLTTHAPATLNRLDFREYYYTVPSAFEYSKFAIRIDMTSSGSKVPLIKNLRAVALV